jgi:FemAB-related protein (PEP-CTERM system-associated)
VSLLVERFGGSAEEWDSFVRSAAGWTHFHLHGWRDVISGSFGHDCPYLAAREESGRLAGVLPLVRVKSLLFGHYLVSMPFLNYGGPLGDAAAARALTRRAVEIATLSRARLLELRSPRPLPLELPASHRKVTVLLDLPPREAGGSKALWESFRSKLRSQIRRPQKEGVEVRFGADQVPEFHAVFARHMRDLGTPALPRAFFEAVAAAFGEDVWFGCARLEGKPIACGCAFRWDGEVELTWASALIAYHAVSPNMLLYWAFLERAADSGLSRFNFGRCTPGGSTHRFKQQWGGRDEPLFWYQHSAGAAAHTPSPDDRAWSWGPWLWRRLPLALATALGPRIVRYIP